MFLTGQILFEFTVDLSRGVFIVIKKIIKRDGKEVEFQPKKITQAIFKAMLSVGNGDIEDAEQFTAKVVSLLDAQGRVPTVEDVQDIVIKVLLEDNIGGKQFSNVAESYILYRDNRRRIREEKKRLSEKPVSASQSQQLLVEEP